MLTTIIVAISQEVCSHFNDLLADLLNTSLTVKDQSILCISLRLLGLLNCLVPLIFVSNYKFVSISITITSNKIEVCGKTSFIVESIQDYIALDLILPY